MEPHTIPGVLPELADGEAPSASSLIGERIRALRHSRALTLVQVAERSGLSQPFLSQVETGRARPSFASVDRIARALGTTQIELFAALADPAEARSTDLSGDAQKLGPSGPFAEGNVTVLAPTALAFSPIEFTAQNVEFGEYFDHAEEEFIFVSQGVVEVDLGDRLLIKTAGESLFLPSHTPHRWRSADTETYRVLSVKEKRNPAESVSLVN